MKASKFLNGIQKLEDKLRQKAGDKTGKLRFPVLVQKLAESNQLDDKTVIEMKKLWELRNKIYSSSTLESLKL